MRVKKARNSISTRMFFSLGVLVIFTVLVSVIAIKTYNSFQQRFNDVAVDGIKAIIAASDLGQFNASLMSFAPSMVAARTQQAKESVMFQVRDQDSLLENAIEELSIRGVSAEQILRLKEYRTELAQSFHELSRLVSKRINWDQVRAERISRVNEIGAHFLNEYHSNVAMRELKHYRDWYVTFISLSGLLNQLNSVEHPVLVLRYQKSFVALEERLNAIFPLISETDKASFRGFLEDVSQHAIGETGLFELNRNKFLVREELDGVFSQHRQTVSRFLSITTSIIEQVETDVVNQNKDIVKVTQQRTIQLVLVAILCISAGAWIFLYIDRSVISRIQTLKTSMEAHVKGLQVPIPLEGNDEITDMASALKVFVKTIQDREQELKFARNEAKRAQVQLVDAIESISEGFSLFNEKDQLVLCNSRYRELYGFPDNWKMEDRDFFGLLHWLAQHDRIKRPSDYLDKRIALRDGKLQSLDLELSSGVWVSVIERRTEQGGMVGVHTDITHRKFSENALRNAMEKAEAADRAKSQFLASASHDLRQPLHAMGLLLEPLLEDTRGTPLYDSVKDVYLAHQSMNQLFSDILDFSRLEAGGVSPNMVHFSVHDLLERLSQEYRHSLENPSSELRMVPSSSVVFADIAMVERIIRNLLSNAIRYSEHGKILLGVRNRDKSVCIQVWDNGPGIPPQEQQAIFMEFYQGKKTQNKGKSGLGLGLAITSQLVKLLNGEIQVTSSSRGSGFSVSLPKGEHAKVKSDADLSAPSVQGMKGLPVLLVENDPQVLETTTQLLKRWDCDVTVFSSFHEFDVQFTFSSRRFLLISDFHLEGNYTALDVMNRLNSAKESDVYFESIVISGDSSPNIRNEAENAGAHFLTKPVGAGKLGALIRYTARKLPKPG